MLHALLTIDSSRLLASVRKPHLTFSKTMFEWRSKAFTRAKILRLLRQLMSTSDAEEKGKAKDIGIGRLNRNHCKIASSRMAGERL